MQKKKHFLLGFNLIVLSLLLTACGFHLRGPVELPLEYRSVYVEEKGGLGLLKRELTEQLGYSTAAVAVEKAKADVIIRILSESRDTRTLSLSRGGKSIQLELTYLVHFDVLDSEGNVLLADQKLEMVRDYYNDQTDVIGKSNEQALIYKEMESRMANLLLRRVRAVLTD
ncbi:MAG: lipoprotein B transmembrane [Gammaproteobacteria bacterium]|nr:MAG: lipoprotein B transmembrane [Gammaproteobacteria bacterium]